MTDKNNIENFGIPLEVPESSVISFDANDEYIAYASNYYDSGIYIHNRSSADLINIIYNSHDDVTNVMVFENELLYSDASHQFHIHQLGDDWRELDVQQTTFDPLR